MFFRRKKKKQEEAENASEKNGPESTIDKIVMGAIIGTAVGSAIGASMAPKKGKETRQIISDQLKTMTDEAKDVQSLTKETASGFLNLAKRLIFGKKKVSKKETHMREIPMETDIIPPEYVDRN